MRLNAARRRNRNVVGRVPGISSGGTSNGDHPERTSVLESKRPTITYGSSEISPVFRREKLKKKKKGCRGKRLASGIVEVLRDTVKIAFFYRNGKYNIRGYRRFVGEANDDCTANGRVEEGPSRFVAVLLVNTRRVPVVAVCMRMYVVAKYPER